MVTSTITQNAAWTIGQSAGKSPTAKVTPDLTRGARAVPGRQQSSLGSLPQLSSSPFLRQPDPPRGGLRLAREQMIIPEKKSRKNKKRCSNSSRNSIFKDQSSSSHTSSKTFSEQCSDTAEPSCGPVQVNLHKTSSKQAQQFTALPAPHLV